MPIFAGEFLTPVMLPCCSDDDEHAGAIELWTQDSVKAPEINLSDDHYGSTAEAFERISRRTSFRKGNRLPGTRRGEPCAGFPFGARHAHRAPLRRPGT